MSKIEELRLLALQSLKQNKNSLNSKNIKEEKNSQINKNGGKDYFKKGTKKKKNNNKENYEKEEGEVNEEQEEGEIFEHVEERQMVDYHDYVTNEVNEKENISDSTTTFLQNLFDSINSNNQTIHPQSNSFTQQTQIFDPQSNNLLPTPLYPYIGNPEYNHLIPFSSTIPFGQYPSNNSNSFLNPIGFPNIQNELKPIPNPSALITNTPPFITNTNPFFSDLSSFSSNSITPESQTFPPFLQIQNNLQLSTLPMTTNLIETSSVSTQESENSFPLSQEQEEQDDSNQSFQFSQSIPSLPQTLPHESNSETKFIDQQPNLVIHLDSESSDEEGEDSPIRSRKVEIVKSSKSKSPSPSVSEEKANSRGSSPFPIGIDRQKEILKLKQIIAQKEKEKKLKQMTEKKRKEIEETKKHLEEKPTPTSSNGNDKEEENLSVTAPPEKKQKPNDTATQAEKLKKLVVIQELKKKIEIQEKLLRQKQMENKTRESKISDCKDQLVDIQHRYSTTTSRLRIFQEQLQTIFDTLTVAEKEKTVADEKLNALNSAQNQRKQKLLSLKRKLESEKLRLKELEIEMKTIQYFKGKSNDKKETNPTKEKATFNLSLSNDNSIKLPSTHSNIQSLTVFRPIKSANPTNFLLSLKSYRLNPAFHQIYKFKFKSPSFSNNINPQKVFCKYELTGICNDDECKYQHKRNYEMTDEQLLNDIASYLIEFNNEEEKSQFLTFVENLKKSSGLSIERKVSQLVEKINGISGEEYYQLAFKRTSLNVRSKINEGISSIRDSKEEEENEESMIVENEEGTSKLDSFIPLTSHTALETILKKNEKDERLIKEYVFQGINNLEHVSDDQRESILKHLSTALELNSTSTYLWAIYFHFYIPCAPSEVDIEELFEDAIHFNPQSDILWHMYVQTVPHLEKKKIISSRALSSINFPSSAVLSHALERLQLFIYSSKSNEILQEFSHLLFSNDSLSLKSLLSIEDLCTLILSFIYGYLTKQYPVPFLIDLRFSFRIVDWSAIKHVKKLKLIYEARQLFKTALHALKKRENGKAFLPLVANSVFMEIALNEFEIARNLCQSFLIQIPNLPELWGLYALVEKEAKKLDDAILILKKSLERFPSASHLYHPYIRLLYETNSDDTLRQIAIFSSMMVDNKWEGKNEFINELKKEHLSSSTIDLVKAIFEELLQLPANINKDILLSNFAMTTPIDFYVCDLYCLFITLTQSQQNTFLVYETTISHLIDVEEQKKLWLRYIEFREPLLLTESDRLTMVDKIFSQIEPYVEKLNPELLEEDSRIKHLFRHLQCPDYSFHNLVLDKLLPIFKFRKVYHHLIEVQPDNFDLIAKLAEYDQREGHISQVRALLSSVTETFSLKLWLMLIRVEISKKNFEKVRFLFSKAIQSRSLLSVNKKLWKSFFQFEMEFGNIQKKEQVVFLAKEKGIYFKIRN